MLISSILIKIANYYTLFFLEYHYYLINYKYHYYNEILIVHHYFNVNKKNKNASTYINKREKTYVEKRSTYFLLNGPGRQIQYIYICMKN